MFSSLALCGYFESLCSDIHGIFVYGVSYRSKTDFVFKF